MQSSGDANLEILKSDLDTLIKRKDNPVDVRFAPLCKKILRNIPSDKKRDLPSFEERKIVPYRCDYSPDDVVLLFNGGKVSTAVALKLREMRKNVKLYYVRVAGADTPDRLYDIAERLHLPLAVDKEAVQPGMFNGMSLAHEGLAYAVQHGFSPKIYMGCFDFASMLNNDYRDWKYCSEFIDTYSHIAKQYVEGAGVVKIMPSYSIVDDMYIRYKEYLQFFK